MQATGIPDPEALSRRAGQTQHQRRLFHARIAVASGNFSREAGADGAITVGHAKCKLSAAARRNGRQRRGEHGLGGLAAIVGVVGRHLTILRLPRGGGGFVQNRGQIQGTLAGRVSGQAMQQVGASDQRVQGRQAQARQPLSRLLRHEGKEVDQHLNLAAEVLVAQALVLRRHAGRAVVQMADAQILAAQGHHGRGAETETLGTQHRRLDHIQPGLHAAVGLHADTAAQTVAAQGLLHLGKTELPGRSGVADRG